MSLQKQRGFTIIEVVLVLAIAGLIFLMVFIALPTLQRNQRDTTRRQDVSRFKAQINQYQTNNKGDVPDITDAASASSFISKYMNNEWNDPKTGSAYGFQVQTDNLSNLGSTEADGGKWTYKKGRVCGLNETMTATGAGNRNYAIAMKLEGSGIFCTDNK